MKKHFINKAVLLMIFIISTMIIEIATFLMEFGTLPKYFLYNISYMFYFYAILMIIGSLKWQIIGSMIILTIHSVIGFSNINMMIATGEIISWDMISLIPEGTKVLGGSTIKSFTCLLVYIPILTITLFLMIKYYKKTKADLTVEEYKKNKEYFYKFRIVSLLFCLLTGLTINNIQMFVLSASEKDIIYKTLDDKYLHDTLYIKQEAYKKFGTYGYYFLDAKNTFNEKRNNKEELKKIRNYFSEAEDTKNMFSGISEGNNVIFILFETWEWMGINKVITPNIYNLLIGNEIRPGKKYDEAILFTNYHAKSQTNISEAQTIFGSYPLKGILNFDYSNNVYPFTLPNKFKEANPESPVVSFHNNDGTYYDRNVSHEHFGFDEHVDGIKMGINFDDTTLWINMDQEIFTRSLLSGSQYADCSPIIPEDLSKPFMSYITTFATHGPYTPEREEYVEKGYYDFVNEYGANNNYEFTTLHGDVLSFQDEIMGDYLKTYMAAAMDFDYGFGLLLNELMAKDLMEDTTIVLMADHFTYYHDLSTLTKGYDITKDEISDIYNVPAMIFDTKLSSKIKETIGEENNHFFYQDYNDDKILSYDKFVTNIDITPTLLNLLNIPYNERHYLGRDMFGLNESFIISRWGGFFNEKIYSRDGYIPLNYPSDYYIYEEQELNGEEIEFTEELTQEEYERLKAQASDFRIKTSEFLVRLDNIDSMYRNNYFYNILNVEEDED